MQACKSMYVLIKRHDVSTRHLMNDNKTTERQQNNLDTYGYTFPPSPCKKLRKTTIRASKSVLGACIYLLMSVLGCLLWPSRLPSYAPSNAPTLTQTSTCSPHQAVPKSPCTIPI